MTNSENTGKRSQTPFGDVITNKNTSAFQKYKTVAVGEKSSFLFFCFFELYNLFIAPLGGALGYLIRKRLAKFLFGQVTGSIIIGKNVVIRNPKNIKLGGNIIIDDNVVLDGKGNGNDGIIIGDDVIIGRNTIISCKGSGVGGSIYIGNNCNIAMFCTLHSESVLKIGDNVLFSAYIYAIAGGNHDCSKTDIPIIEQPSIDKGGINISDNVWVGAHCMIMDGINVDDGVVIGACSLINKDLPKNAIAFGHPAKVHSIRGQK